MVLFHYISTVPPSEILGKDVFVYEATWRYVPEENIFWNNVMPTSRYTLIYAPLQSKDYLSHKKKETGETNTYDDLICEILGRRCDKDLRIKR